MVWSAWFLNRCARDGRVSRERETVTQNERWTVIPPGMSARREWTTPNAIKMTTGDTLSEFRAPHVSFSSYSLLLRWKSSGGNWPQSVICTGEDNGSLIHFLEFLHWCRKNTSFGMSSTDSCIKKFWSAHSRFYFVVSVLTSKSWYRNFHLIVGCNSCIYWTLITLDYRKALTPGDTWPQCPGGLDNRVSCVRGWAHRAVRRGGNWPLHRHGRTVQTHWHTHKAEGTREEEEGEEEKLPGTLRLTYVLTWLTCFLKCSLCRLTVMLAFRIQIKTFNKHYTFAPAYNHSQTLPNIHKVEEVKTRLASLTKTNQENHALSSLSCWTPRPDVPQRE